MRLLPSLLDGYARYASGSRAFLRVPVGLVVVFGGMIAILAAVAVTCRDLSEPLLTFWASRPMGELRYLAVRMIG